MKVALLVMAAIGLAALVVALMPVRVRMTLKGRGQFGDTWVIAGGLEALGFTVSVAAAHATDRLVQLHFLGWRMLSKRFAPAERSTVDRDLGKLIDRLNTLRRRVERRFDREALVGFVLGLRRHVSLTRLRGDITYCTPDVALTGMDIETAIRLYPGRAAAAVVWFVVKNIRLRVPAEAGAAAQAQALPAQS